ncbi:MAG: alpha/beta hydrolase [Deltaproteobacteria bacterium]|nr:MAG: alpha/beta hydrolase [Deltaproteobacteria bacterium]
MIALYGLVGLGFLLVLGYGLGLWLYSYDSKPDRIVYVETTDGWQLGVEVHDALGERQGVVLTFHGVGLNHYSFDFCEGHSLVTYLKERGYEVWNVDFRGHGHSKGQGKHQQQWGVDEHIRYDLPAVLDAAIADSGVQQVHCVGHSMGGLVLYAYLATHPEEHRVASLCTLGASRVLCASWGVWLFAWFGKLVTLLLPKLPMTLWSQATAVFLIPPPFSVYVSYPPNISGHVFRRRFFKMSESLCRRIFREVLVMLSEQRLRSMDHADNYEALLPQITLPTCFIGGVLDPLAQCSSIKEVHDLVSSEVKEFHILGTEHGATRDYGHEDLLLAQSSSEEVYPLVEKWLTRVSARRKGA